MCTFSVFFKLRICDTAAPLEPRSLILPRPSPLCCISHQTWAWIPRETPRLLLQETLTDLFKYLAIARRARGDLPGAKEALGKVESLGGSKGREDVEGLDRLMAENEITVD